MAQTLQTQLPPSSEATFFFGRMLGNRPRTGALLAAKGTLGAESQAAAALCDVGS